jgi:hypothetical protein
MPYRCSTKRRGGAATARCAAGVRLRCLSPRLYVSRLVHAKARLWGVPAGRALNPVVLRAESGAPSR